MYTLQCSISIASSVFSLFKRSRSFRKKNVRKHVALRTLPSPRMLMAMSIQLMWRVDQLSARSLGRVAVSCAKLDYSDFVW